MGNIQGVWILCGGSLALNFLNAYEWIAAADIYMIGKVTVVVN